ncbi:MAG TPA: D-alanyl-D-alanine carboxypeptidase [Trebonia sp.]|nr:D-alanyl-D-alanine carboxypeptidase [Trebonia sp.]
MRIGGRLASGIAAVALVAAGLITATGAGARAAADTARPASGPAGVNAPWAELANAATGADMWSRSPATERPMGSITKVMTAYVVIEAGHLNRVITVPKGIIGYDHKFDASTAGLVPGEKLTALQLLYAMLLPSGCDAAYTLADGYGPGLSAFVKKMNATAARLGLKRTHFTDWSGLPNPGQYTTYSTAGELVSLGRDAMRLALFRQIVAARSYRVAAGHGHDAHAWKNLDLLLTSYPGAIGIKTGFTAAAGECFLFEARRGSRTLIGVVLHSSPDNRDAIFNDAAKMLNWGFSQKS